VQDKVTLIAIDPYLFTADVNRENNIWEK